MERLKDLLAQAEHILLQVKAEGEAKLCHHEQMGLHIRKALEIIAFASLVANKDKYATVYRDFANHWNAKRLLTNLRAINSEFYPTPIDVENVEPNALRFDILRSGYLTQDEFIELYGYSSRALHEPNPFRRPSWKSRYPMYQWIDRIIMLMRVHQIRLVDSSHYWIVKLASEEHGASGLLAAVRVNDDEVNDETVT